MKRQVDFDIRVWNLTPAGTDGTQTRADMLKYTKETYPADEGWEVVSVQSPGYDTGAVALVVFVAKYEYSDESGVVINKVKEKVK